MLHYGGYLFISVPNTEVLYTLLLKREYPDNVRDVLYTMVYGGQTDAYNYHIVSISTCSCAIYVYVVNFRTL